MLKEEGRGENNLDEWGKADRSGWGREKQIVAAGFSNLSGGMGV